MLCVAVVQFMETWAWEPKGGWFNPAQTVSCYSISPFCLYCCVCVKSVSHMKDHCCPTSPIYCYDHHITVFTDKCCIRRSFVNKTDVCALKLLGASRGDFCVLCVWFSSVWFKPSTLQFMGTWLRNQREAGSSPAQTFSVYGLFMCKNIWGISQVDLTALLVQPVSLYWRADTLFPQALLKSVEWYLRCWVWHNVVLCIIISCRS